ncbi:MAG: proline racemase family protein [Chloroflexi bacterium]|nr:proline racemase family protein [Chloroflexota bacterium]
MVLNWQPPDDWIRITTIDAHTAGEPLRVITGGYPNPPGDTILAKRRYARKNLDHLRTALMWEPRGHADMYGCIITEPERPSSDLGVLFLHNEGYSSMCGHGIIGLAKVGLDTGLIDKPGANPIIKMDTPAGLVTAYAQRDGKNGHVSQVSFHNVPSFVYALDEVADVPGIGSVRYDVAFGGAFYAFCRAEDLGVGLTGADFRQLIDVGMRVKTAVMDTLPISHPFADDLGFLYGTIIVGAAHNPAHHSRNVCIFADGEVDRCPTGTGVSARAALHYARGELRLNEPFIVESILGTTFTGQVVEIAQFGPYDAIIPKVTGTARITGRNELLIDPSDALRDGFILR